MTLVTRHILGSSKLLLIILIKINTLTTAGTEYKITLRTSTRSWAGTDSGIYVILKGSNGNTKEHVLDTHNHNDFR